MDQAKRKQTLPRTLESIAVGDTAWAGQVMDLPWVSDAVSGAEAAVLASLVNDFAGEGIGAGKRVTEYYWVVDELTTRELLDLQPLASLARDYPDLGLSSCGPALRSGTAFSFGIGKLWKTSLA